MRNVFEDFSLAVKERTQESERNVFSDFQLDGQGERPFFPSAPEEGPPYPGISDSDILKTARGVMEGTATLPPEPTEDVRFRLPQGQAKAPWLMRTIAGGEDEAQAIMKSNLFRRNPELAKQYQSDPAMQYLMDNPADSFIPSVFNLKLGQDRIEEVNKLSQMTRAERKKHFSAKGKVKTGEFFGEKKDLREYMLFSGVLGDLKSREFKESIERLQKNDYPQSAIYKGAVSPDKMRDQLIVRDKLLRLEEIQDRGQNIPSEILDSMSSMVKYAGEIYLMGGLMGGPAPATQLGKLGLGATMGAMNVGELSKLATERMTPKGRLGDKGEFIQTEKGQHIAMALPKSLVEQTATYWTEQQGEVIGKYLNRIGGKVLSKLPKGMASVIMKSRRLTKPFYAALKKGKLDGMAPELVEEYIDRVIKPVLKLDDQYRNADDDYLTRVAESLVPDPREVLVQTATFSLMPVAGHFAGAVGWREGEEPPPPEPTFTTAAGRTAAGFYEPGRQVGVPPYQRPAGPAVEVPEGRPVSTKLEEARQEAEEKLGRKVTKVSAGAKEGPLIARLYSHAEELIEQAQTEQDQNKRNAILDELEQIDNVIGQLSRENLEGKSITQLQKMAKRFGVEVPKGAEKAEIIGLLAGKADLNQIQKTDTGYQVKIPIAETKAGRGWEVHEFDTFAGAVDFLEEREEGEGGVPAVPVTKPKPPTKPAAPKVTPEVTPEVTPAETEPQKITRAEIGKKKPVSLTDNELKTEIDQLTKAPREKKYKDRLRVTQRMQSLNREYTEREKERISGMKRAERYRRRKEAEDEIRETPQYQMALDKIEGLQGETGGYGVYYVPKGQSTVVDEILSKKKGFPTRLQRMFTHDPAKGKHVDEAFSEAQKDALEAETGVSSQGELVDIDAFIDSLIQQSELDPLDEAIKELGRSDHWQDLALVAQYQMLKEGNYTEQDIKNEIEQIRLDSEAETWENISEVEEDVEEDTTDISQVSDAVEKELAEERAAIREEAEAPEIEGDFLEGLGEEAEEKPAEKKKEVTTADTKRAARLRKIADTMDKHIENKRREMTQNPTPKRMKEYNSRLHDADNMERTQKAMRAMADALEKGELPAELENVKAKADITKLVYKGLQPGGYYDVIPAKDYRDTSKAGKTLQRMIEKGETAESKAEREKREREHEIKKAEEKFRFLKIKGFFPTPRSVTDDMIERADIDEGMSVLEPSAGKGDIADVLKEQGHDVKVVEIRPALQEILRMKGHDVVGDDFLEHEGKYDRILMNPPFEKGQGIDHVRHAYDQLKPGGRIVAIMGEGTFFRDQKKYVAFREWLAEVGGISERLPEGAFKGIKAFKQTGVNARIVEINKPEGKAKAESKYKAGDEVYVDAGLRSHWGKVVSAETDHLGNWIYGVKSKKGQTKYWLEAVISTSKEQAAAKERVKEKRAEREKSVEDHINNLVTLFGVTRKQALGVVALWNANAQVQGITLNEWYDKHIADIKKGEKSAVLAAAESHGVKMQAAVNFRDDGKAILHALKGANVSSLAHETAHIFRRTLKDDSLKVAEDFCDVTDGKWTVEAEEKFARAFERYLRDGKAPSVKLKSIFEQFKEWLTEIYKTISGSSLDIAITPEIREVFDKLLTSDTIEREYHGKEKPTTGTGRGEADTESARRPGTGGRRRSTEAAKRDNIQPGETPSAEQLEAAQSKKPVIQSAELIPEVPEQDFSIFGPKTLHQEAEPVFFSKLERAVSAKMPNKMSSEAFRNWATKQGIKKEEMLWSGVDELLTKKDKVTKADVLDTIAVNNIQIEEVEKGGIRTGEKVVRDLHEVQTDINRLRLKQERIEGDIRIALSKLSEDQVRDKVKDWETSYYILNQPKIISETAVGRPGATREQSKTAINDLKQLLPEHNWTEVESVSEKYYELGEEHDRVLDYEYTHEGTQFSQYTLPGGENYREVLLRLPEIGEQKKFDTKKVTIQRARMSTTQGETTLYYENTRLARFSDNPKRQSDGTYKQQPDSHWLKVAERLFNEGDKINRIKALSGRFTESHWSESNVLAHFRMDDRTDKAGNKVLFIEEIQSDWHQKGRQFGYQEEGEDYNRYEVRNMTDYSVLDTYPTREAAEAAVAETKDPSIWSINYKAQVESSVPDAPFKTTWHELAFKRILRYAAEEGYDTVAWTTGEQQADRYDLRKYVDKVEADKQEGDNYNIVVYEKGKSYPSVDKSVKGKDLSEFVGKELADKISKQEKGWHTYKELDLKVGGEGMKGFYDKMLPAFVKKYMKKWGVKGVGEAEIATAGVSPKEQKIAAEKGVFAEAVHAVPVTDSMKESVMSGQVLFQAEERKDLEKLVGPVRDKDLLGREELKGGAAGRQAEMFDKEDFLTLKERKRINAKGDIEGQGTLFQAEGGTDFLDDNQKQGINLAVNSLNRGDSFLLADGTGFGKTRQIIAVAALIQKQAGKPALIITQSQQIIENNFKPQAEAIGVDLSEIEIGTYSGLRTGKVGKGDYSVVILDEAHNLKHKDTGKSIAAANVKTDTKMFATATPMDSPTAASYFLSQVSGVPEKEVQRRLGYHIESYLDFHGNTKHRAILNEGSTWSIVVDHIIDMRNKAVEKGNMIRREIPFKGTLEDKTIQLTGDYRHEQADIYSYWQSRIKRTRSRKAKINLGGQRTGELSRYTEIKKLPAVFEAVMADLKAGKKVIVVAEGVNPTKIKALQKTVPGFLGQFQTMLTQAGYDYAQLFNASKLEGVKNRNTAKEHMRFQNDEVQIALMTPQTGGAGIDLDDSVGNNSRTMYVVTKNYSGDVFDQILGRVSRRNTKSPVRIVFVSAEGAMSDNKRDDIVNRKMRTLQAIQRGEDLDRAYGFEITDENGNSQILYQGEMEKATPQDVQDFLWRKRSLAPLRITKDQVDPEDLLDGYFAERDEKRKEAYVDRENYRNEIKVAMGGRKHGGWRLRHQKADMAMQVYIDLKNNPDQMKYYDKLSKKQKALVDMAQNLPAELKKIADRIARQNKALGIEAYNKGVINNVLENYTMRLWVPEKQRKSNWLHRKFGLKTARAKHRTLEGILHGWTKGKELQISGATEAQEVMRQQVSDTIVNRQLLKTGKEYGLISHQRHEGWERIEHPNFVDWRWAGKASAAVRDYGYNFFVTKEGNLMKQVPMYATPKLAKHLNKVLGTSALYKIPGVTWATEWNARLKRWILFTSFFHHQAYVRSYNLGGRTGFANMSPKKAYEAGRTALENFTPDLRRGVRNGLTIGEIRDYDKAILRGKHTLIGRILRKAGSVDVVVRQAERLRDWNEQVLFGKLGPYLKIQAYLLEYKSLVNKNEKQIKNGTKTLDDLAKMAAELINDDFGGLHLDRKGRNPTVQHLFRLLALAPDWTESNVASAIKAFKRGEGGRVYRAFWARIASKGIAALVIFNYLMAMYDEDEETEESTTDRFLARYKEAWKTGKLRWLDVDITPIYKMLGGKADKRKYFSLLGHFKDPIKFIARETIKDDKGKPTSVPDPLRSLITSAKYKGSVSTRIIADGITGKNWAGREFTTISELFGWDNKGVYSTTRLGMYAAGEPKGGKLKGQLTKWSMEGVKPLGLDQVPSYLIWEAKSNMPIQVQNAIAYLNGQADGFDAILKSAGVYVSSTYSPYDKLKNLSSDDLIRMRMANTYSKNVLTKGQIYGQPHKGKEQLVSEINKLLAQEGAD